jgi:hypothetical protein
MNGFGLRVYEAIEERKGKAIASIIDAMNDGTDGRTDEVN